MTRYAQIDKDLFDLFKKVLITVHGISEESIEEFENRMITEYASTTTG